ncbi:uncharacterized protein LOC110102466 [Dendrobium catenatum]|uniref:uncharacterized protein LOC110102466 n=1 Tax=Dendrobium catenatum TaxID=906689 RepID=UPI0009F4F890|nr:uncharacterized protein LOC110102466 [Dendrobium catenatum]
MTNQFIHGTITTDSNDAYAVIAVYASNSHSERQILWKNIQDLAVTVNTPWAILGDFNCCRELGEKEGGTALYVTKLGDFNSMIFNAGIHDLSSVGHFYTWHNQQIYNPIHIKLDRVLVNDYWLHNFPNSYYIVEDLDCSDHSSLILVNSDDNKRGHRFLFKNYCTKFPDFWGFLMEAFSLPNKSSPLSSFNFKLKSLKNSMKHKKWTNSNLIQVQIDTLKDLQHSVLAQIQTNPLDHYLNGKLHQINTNLAHNQAALSS